MRLRSAIVAVLLLAGIAAFSAWFVIDGQPTGSSADGHAIATECGPGTVQDGIQRAGQKATSAGLRQSSSEESASQPTENDSEATNNDLVADQSQGRSPRAPKRTLPSAASPEPSPTPVETQPEPPTPADAPAPKDEAPDPAILQRVTFNIPLKLYPSGSGNTGAGDEVYLWLADELLKGQPIADPALEFTFGEEKLRARGDLHGSSLTFLLEGRWHVGHPMWPHIAKFFTASVSDLELPTMRLSTMYYEEISDAWNGIIGSQQKPVSIELGTADGDRKTLQTATVTMAPIALSTELHARNDLYLCRFRLVWQSEDLGKLWSQPPNNIDNAPEPSVRVVASSAPDDIVDTEGTGLYADGVWTCMLTKLTHKGPREPEVLKAMRLHVGFPGSPRVMLPPPTIRGAIADFGTIQFPCHTIRMRARTSPELRLPDGSWPTVDYDFSHLGEGRTNFFRYNMELGDWQEFKVPVGTGWYSATTEFEYPEDSSVLWAYDDEQVVDLRDRTPGVYVVEARAGWSGFHVLRSDFSAGTDGPEEVKTWSDNTEPGVVPTVLLALKPEGTAEDLPELPRVPDLSAILGKQYRDPDLDKEKIKQQFEVWDAYGPKLAAALQVPEEIGKALVQWERPWDPREPRARTISRPVPYRAGRLPLPIFAAVPTADTARLGIVRRQREASENAAAIEAEARKPLSDTPTDEPAADPSSETTDPPESVPDPNAIVEDEVGEYDHFPDAYYAPSPDQLAAIALPIQAPLGGTWILLANDRGWAIYWLDHNKPADLTIRLRPWSDLGWHWKTKN